MPKNKKLSQIDVAQALTVRTTSAYSPPSSAVTSGDDADTVDGYHAWSSPVASALLALNASAQYPATVIPDAVAGAGLIISSGVLAIASADTSVTINADSIQVALATTSGLAVSSGLMLADTVAGNGLTIGSKILAVGAGDGIDVAADAVAVDVTDIIDTSYGLTEDTNNIRINAGAGLTFSTGALVVGAGNGITVNADDVALTTPGTLTVSSTNSASGNHTHAVTSSANPGAAASLLASDANGYLQLVRLGAGTAPAAPLHALATTEQLRLGYDAAKYASFTQDTSGNLTIDVTGTKVIVADDLQVSGNDILDSAAATRVTLGATTTLTNTTTTLSGTTTLTASSLTTLTTAAALALTGATGLTASTLATITTAAGLTLSGATSLTASTLAAITTAAALTLSGATSLVASGLAAMTVAATLTVSGMTTLVAAGLAAATTAATVTVSGMTTFVASTLAALTTAATVTVSGMTALTASGLATLTTAAALAMSSTTTLTLGGTALLVGGTAAGSSLSLKSTSGTGTTDFVRVLVGNNGAVEAWRAITGGAVGFGTTSPDRRVEILDASNPQLRLSQADSTYYADFQVGATGDLTITPSGGDLMWANTVTVSTTDWASQVSGWGITGAGYGDFRYIYTDELHAKLFIADLEQALAGGQIIAKSVAPLYSAFTIPLRGSTASMVVKSFRASRPCGCSPIPTTCGCGTWNAASAAPTAARTPASGPIPRAGRRWARRCSPGAARLRGWASTARQRRSALAGITAASTTSSRQTRGTPGRSLCGCARHLAT